jgi:hypothetical protein
MRDMELLYLRRAAFAMKNTEGCAGAGEAPSFD